MVDLADLPRREADLVAVGAVACGRAERDLFLRELARARLAERTTRVGSTRHAHGLIDVRAAGQRVADRAAETGRRAAERLDFRRMVVRLVLELDEPVLRLPAHVDGHDDAARVDLLGLVEVVELARLPERLHADDGDIHERHVARRRAVDLIAVLLVLVVRLQDGRREIPVLHIDHVDGRRECRVAAVVGPVRVDDAQLRDRRRAVLRVAEIFLAEREILEAHGKAALRMERGELPGVHEVERLQHRDVRGLLGMHFEGFRFRKRGLAALDLVDAVGLDFLEVLEAHVADDDDDARRRDPGALFLRHELHALRCGVRTLVELARQILHGKHAGVREMGQLFLIDDIDGRLREHDGLDLRVLAVIEPLDVVAVDDAHGLQPREAERLREVVAQLARLDVKKALPFFHENSSY